MPGRQAGLPHDPPEEFQRVSAKNLQYILVRMAPAYQPPDDVLPSCLLTEMDTRFNTANFEFDICDDDPGDCNESGGYDVQAVSVHEFGHWFILEHTQWWRFGCVMRATESEARTLCGDDRNGMQFIYGED